MKLTGNPVRRYSFFLLNWLFLGFAIGTFILLVPLRSWVTYVRDNALSELTEKVGVIALMVVVVVVSFGASFLLNRWHIRKKSNVISAAILIASAVVFAGAVSLLSRPELLNPDNTFSEASPAFTIGSYPNESDIEALKEAGYTGIITLLHPAVIPFEPTLLHQEAEAAARHNIDLIRAPMLPWISDNTSSLDIIEKIVRSGKGKYFIHCYLGKDRVNVVRNLIVRISGDSSLQMQKGATARTFEQMKSFERGDLYKLAPEIYMTPFPTNEEFLAFFLAGNVRSVVCLMDSTVSDNQQWISGERRDLTRAVIKFNNFPVHERSSDNEIRRIVQMIDTLGRPLVVHHWNTTSPESRKFRQAFAEAKGSKAINLASGEPE